MSTGDEPANLSAIAPPKMVLPMSLQLSYGTAAETNFKPTGGSWPPDFRLSTPICRDSRMSQRPLSGLPATGNATPTTYEWQGRQYVVIAAGGGHGETGSPANDTLVAFALPRPGESTPSPWLSWIDKPGGRFELHAGVVAFALVAALVLLIRWRRGRRRRRAQAAR
jgi:hypothetical protein